VTEPVGGGPFAVECENVTTIIGQEVVLHRLRWQVRAGATTVLMGPSGCGKTTLVRHLVGLARPGSGRVCVLGQPVWELAEARRLELGRSLAVMLGGSTLFDSSTRQSDSVLDNVTYPLRARGMDPVTARSRAWDGQLRQLDLTPVADQLPGEVAARTRRRVALAAALTADAPLFVLDDIDTAIDGEHRDAVLSAVRAARARSDATMMITTHDLDLARALADDIAVLCHGRIVASGPARQILDGVTSAADFDHRFNVMDFIGPPDQDAARAAAGGGARRAFSVDLALVAYVLVLVLAAVLLAMLLGQAGSRGNL
jgi:phospholipid/cholesterol/gamma-HCH transport system ATP-binding protein